ncbi:peptidase M28-like protein [Isoptericola sp. CG 20/1183]|uniref:Vacuolar membrane protease n=1 Tax=Isoptericola halotolerans TaxID=300560 RepID=A0ABX5EFQ4_9MICO|nr:MULTISPECIES: M28 family peptidase [Isoptericola]PRZ05724.1 peptidase M28-like protein [Isoptericola halotolerans]PRZ06292.1 peptidase M28-like protein [Isoptericola sp. CG 20/1183]
MNLRSRATTLLIWLFLAALAAVSVWSVLPPSPRGADAPADEFSAERAFADVERVGTEVHPHGTAANDAVREYLVDRLTGLGLEPEVVDGVGMSGRLGDQSRVAATQNVVATVPGADPTAPVFLVAHYDSAEVSYGGNDDGAGVATILETVRALGEGPALRNDVVVVLTDAEEACLCGAEAFVDADPRAADGGVVVNFEARGSAGPAVMFETSDGNAALVDAYASVPYPVGSSLAVEVYRILPNDTDFSPFLDDPAGRFTGLNAAYIDGSATYHSPLDVPERMSLASLQHHGSNALALVRTLGDADATALAAPSATDATYFPLPGGILARYPGWLVWPLALAALGAVAALAVLVVRRRGGGHDDGGTRTAGPARLVLGFLAGVLPLAGAVLGAMGLWALMVTVRPGYDEMLDPWQPWGFRVALLGIVAVVVTGWFVGLRRWLGAPALVVGALGWLAVLGVALAALAPGGSYLAALPALAGAAAGIVALRLESGRWRALAVALGAAVGVVLLAPITVLFFPALGLETGAAPAVVAVLLGLALVPALALSVPERGRSGGWLVGACALVAAGALGVGFAVDSFDAEHPEPSRLAYALDADTGEAVWVSTESTPSDWTARYVDAREDRSAQFPPMGSGAWFGAAEAADLPAPTVAVVDDVTSGDERTVTLRVRPGEGEIGTAGALRYIELNSAAQLDAVLAASVAGREVPVDDDGILDTRFYAPDGDGFEVTLTVRGGEGLDLRVVAAGGGLEGLPGFTERPDGVGVGGSHSSELVLVATTVVL